MKHAPLMGKIPDAGVVCFKENIALKVDLVERSKDRVPRHQASARNAAIVFTRVDSPQSVAHRPNGLGVVSDFGDHMICIEQHVEVGVVGSGDEVHNLS